MDTILEFGFLALLMSNLAGHDLSAEFRGNRVPQFTWSSRFRIVHTHILEIIRGASNWRTEKSLEIVFESNTVCCSAN